MKILRNASLKTYNTFRLDYTAREIIHATNPDEVAEAIDMVPQESKLMIMGGGSNLLFTGDFDGTIIHPEIPGINIEEKHNGKVIVSAGAGVNWDSLVEWCVRNSLYGLENLSLIPGDSGASAVQNIGAYGTEVRDVIVKVEAISVREKTARTFSAEECEFAYRYSIFKGKQKGNYIVTRVHFMLSEEPVLNIRYSALKEALQGMDHLTLHDVRRAVIDIRRSKLPDPEITGNAGSFFKNPVIGYESAMILKEKYPSMPVFSDENGKMKLAAGWLIEQCGWKGKRSGNAAVHDRQALVLINCGKATGNEIFRLSEDIRSSVMEKFGVELEREVEIVNPI